MATTTDTFVVSDDNVTYETPYEFDSNGLLTTTGTISGANDHVEVDYGSNDVLLVTGTNDSVADYQDGYGLGGALINAQNAGGNSDLQIHGPVSTVLGSAGNDTIISYGGFTESFATSEGANGATVTDNSMTVTTVGNQLYGEAGDDTIVFYGGDTVYGGQGNDTIYVNDYNDGYSNTFSNGTTAGYGDLTPARASFISADAGNDYINMQGASGNDTAYGGTGDDTIVGGSANGENLYGQAGNDLITTTGYDAIIYGGAGDDTIVASGFSGGNFISADLGNDTVDLSASTGGDNTVYGGAGDDTIYGSAGTGDQIYGQTGNDTIYLNAAGSVYGGQGNDLIYDQGHGNSFISGDDGDDSVFATGGNDTVYGGDGNDSILATMGGDSLYGNAGNDHITVTVADGTATVFGGSGDDTITVTYTTTASAESYTGHATTIDANGYTYAANGTYTTTTVDEGAGAHYLSGDIGNDTLSGGSGGDTFVGGAGTDTLISHRMEATGDTPSGEPGNDPLAPGYEAGGPADSFIFYPNDSYGGNPAGTGTGSDITNSGGEAGLDHITGFELNVTGQAYNAGSTMGTTAESFVNAQAGDNLYFLSAAHSTTASTGEPDTNVFYGTVDNTVPGSTATEASDYAVAYAYAFGTGGTAAAPGAGAAFANSADYIVVDVVDTGGTNNGNVFVFDHNGNAVALDGAGLGSTGTDGTFQNSTNPVGGLPTTEQNGLPNSVTTVNIYH